MKNLKKIGSILMTAVMTMALSTSAFAADAAEFNNGVAGSWSVKDTEIVQSASINLKKEIIAFNPNGTTVHAPEITYTYSVTPAEVDGLTVTDDKNDHASEIAVSAPVQAGITAGVKVNGGESGSASAAIGTLAFTNNDSWITDPEGKVNSSDINLDFNGVSFSKPGVYRYRIDETTSAAYDEVAMKDGGTNTVYLDVYVDGNLRIYGYVCMADNKSVSPDSPKINGFVNGSDSDGSDKYYTYDLTVSKNVENDAYGEKNIAFPYTIIFSNPENYTSRFTIDETVGSGSEGIKPAANSAPTWNGVAKVKEGGAITYTGIPAGIDVTIYETNVATGVTYSAQTKINGAAAGDPDNAVIWGSAPTAAAAQTEKADWESTARTVDTNKIENTDSQSFEIINTLLLISPTGVALRVAPFVLMMAAGAVLLLFARRRRAEAEG